MQEQRPPTSPTMAEHSIEVNEHSESIQGHEALHAMLAEIAESSELYRPSRFWDDLNQINQAMLDELGLENLKRTLAQNYFNWLITSRKDPQYLAVRKLWAKRPSLQPYLNRLEKPTLLTTLQPYLRKLKNPSVPLEAMGPEFKIGARQLRAYKLF